MYLGDQNLNAFHGSEQRGTGRLAVYLILFTFWKFTNNKEMNRLRFPRFTKYTTVTIINK